jgi:hypothetical protein
MLSACGIMGLCPQYIINIEAYTVCKMTKNTSWNRSAWFHRYVYEWAALLQLDTVLLVIAIQVESFNLHLTLPFK